METLQDTDFARRFAAYTTLDLVEEFTHGRLADAVEPLRRRQFIIATSYHVTLLARVLGVPAFHLAFNAYYRQKRQGFGQEPPSLQAFLAAEREQLVQTDRHYVQEQRDVRRRWLQVLTDVLSAPAPDPEVLVRASAALDSLRRQQLEKQSGQPFTVAGRWSAEQSRRRIEQLEAQLGRLMSSRSWRLTAPLRRLGAALRRARRR